MTTGTTTERRPARKGWPAFLAQFILFIVAFVSLAVAVPHILTAVDRHGWERHDGTVSSVEPLYDVFAVFGALFGGGVHASSYKVAVKAEDGLFFVETEERPMDGQALTVYVDPETRDTILESPWVPTRRGAGAIAVATVATAGWALIEWRSRKRAQPRSVIEGGLRHPIRPFLLLMAMVMGAFALVFIGELTDPAPLGVAGAVVAHLGAVFVVLVSLARRRMLGGVMAIVALAVPVAVLSIADSIYGPCFLFCSESEDAFYRLGIPLSGALQMLALLAATLGSTRIKSADD